VAYLLVVLEDIIKLRKSKPVVLGAGLIWILVAIAFHGAPMEVISRVAEQHNLPDSSAAPAALLSNLVKHHLADFAELFLFLMVAMTYISAIAERNVFLKINAWLVSAGYGLRTVFWATGTLAFFISPVADNLTTALLMGAVVVTVGGTNARFVSLSCINVVVAANAGGAPSPFGDITTLMVWQANKVHTFEFIKLIVPSLVNWLVPAFAMCLFISKDKPPPLKEDVELKAGWYVVITLFLATIATAVTFHAKWGLPPFLGMTTGLGYFFVYGFVRRLREVRMRMAKPVDVLQNVADVEWDTLLFFFGVIMCVGGLGELGYLKLCSEYMYGHGGPYIGNISVGLISAVLDNVPVMFAVLKMDPESMSPDIAGTETALFHWLLVTLTAGVGGSLLSVGSAAGVALMGTAHGKYTFTSHLRWTPAILLGYGDSIFTHHLPNYPHP